jgi:hypothetical protein
VRLLRIPVGNLHGHLLVEGLLEGLRALVEGGGFNVRDRNVLLGPWLVHREVGRSVLLIVRLLMLLGKLVERWLEAALPG